MPNPKILLNNKEVKEYSLCQLFPKHMTFYCFNTGDCEVLKYKRDSKFNFLNWLGEPEWPHENANLHLSYFISNDTIYDFIAKYDYDFDKSFLYIDFTSNDMTLTNDLFDKYISKIIEIKQVRTMIVYPSTLDISNRLLLKIEKWKKQNYLLININSSTFINVLTNYEIKDTSIGSVGSNAQERQGVERKSDRWVTGFDKLPDKEKDFILMNIVTSYLKEK